MPTHFKQTLKSFFRIHLLTAIVLVLTIGVILGLNLRIQHLRRSNSIIDNCVYARGFPMLLQTWYAYPDGSEMKFDSGDPNQENFFERIVHTRYAYDSETLEIKKTQYMRWIVNIAAALLSLFVVAYPVEFMLRNRDRQGAHRNPKIE